VQHAAHHPQPSPHVSTLARLQIPWGNTGAALNAVCLSGIYQKLGINAFTDQKMKDARCLMQRELGYLTNHKCARSGYKCNTATAEGWSYMVGCALHARATPRRKLSEQKGVPRCAILVLACMSTIFQMRKQQGRARIGGAASCRHATFQSGTALQHTL
jgi:hypothetical protein